MDDLELESIHLPANSSPRNIDEVELAEIPSAQTRPDNALPIGQPMDTLCKIRLRLWWGLGLIIITIEILMVIGCLATPSWIHQGRGRLQINGGLLECYDCPNELDETTYRDFLSEDYCDNVVYDDLQGLCTTIKNLKLAGELYISFTMVCLLTLLAWGTFIVFKILKKTSCLPWWVAYLIPVSAVITKFLAVALWGIISEARFHNSSDCDVLATEDELNICATDGPAYAISIYLSLVITSVMFVIVNYADQPKKVDLPNQQVSLPDQKVPLPAQLEVQVSQV